MCRSKINKYSTLVNFFCFILPHLLVFLLSRLLNKKWYQHGVLLVLKHRLCSFPMYTKYIKLPGRQTTFFAWLYHKYILTNVSHGPTNNKKNSSPSKMLKKLSILWNLTQLPKSTCARISCVSGEQLTQKKYCASELTQLRKISLRQQMPKFVRQICHANKWIHRHILYVTSPS